MHRTFSWALAPVVLLGLLCTPASRTGAAVVIVANRTQSPVRFTARAHDPHAAESATKASAASSAEPATKPALSLDLIGADSKSQRHVVESGDCIALELKPYELLWVWGSAIASHQLRPYGVYYFGSTRAGKIELREIGLAAAREHPTPPAGLVGAMGDLHPAVSREQLRERDRRSTINVAIFADDDEPAVERLWKERLQDRVAEASKILARSCGMKLAVKSFGQWESDDSIHDFELSLREFERTVSPGDAQLAIGFTSQYQITRGRTHLGGTHGPLQPHILLREWSQHVSESERLELLVHELAHYLGAVHSPEPNSVMRPLLGDRQARARAFRIAIDPINALAMSVVGEEIRDRGIGSFSELSEASRVRLESIYATLLQAMPDDPAAAAYLQFTRRSRRLP